jgi:tetratricopeptide (TPR) repeat protein
MADKLTKKELEQPDEFHTIGWHVLQYILEHRDRFYLAGAVLLLIIILSGGWYFYRSDYESKAQALYSSAYNSYSLPGSSAADDMKGAYLKGLQIYEELVKKYPSSRAAMLSFYNMGNLYFNIGETEKSITAYKLFLKRSSDDILTALAYHGLGYCYEEAKDYDSALKSFEDSNKRVQGTRFEYINYVNIARTYEKMGRQKEAVDFYSKAAGKTGDPLMEMLVKRKMAALAP